MISPHYRRKASSAVSTVSSLASSTLSFGGKALWVLSTSAFFVGIPWALAFADEQQFVQMEREQGMIKGANEVGYFFVVTAAMLACLLACWHMWFNTHSFRL